MTQIDGSAFRHEFPGPSNGPATIPPEADRISSGQYHESDAFARELSPIEEGSRFDLASTRCTDRPRQRVTEKKARDNLKDEHDAIAVTLEANGMQVRGRAKNVRSLLELFNLKTQKLKDIETELAAVKQTYSRLGFVEDTDPERDLDVAALCNTLHSRLLTERESNFRGYFFYLICEACPICTDEFTAQQG